MRVFGAGNNSGPLPPPMESHSPREFGSISKTGFRSNSRQVRFSPETTGLFQRAPPPVKLNGLHVEAMEDCFRSLIGPSSIVPRWLGRILTRGNKAWSSNIDGACFLSLP